LGKKCKDGLRGTNGQRLKRGKGSGARRLRRAPKTQEKTRITASRKRLVKQVGLVQKNFSNKRGRIEWQGGNPKKRGKQVRNT